jgi:saccharopine dehydrogenase-like NADP-dependent oxidoreductase
MLGLHSKIPIQVKGIKVAPVDLVAALLPNPADLGDRMTGKTCVGTLVTGIKDNKPRKVYLYQITDNAESMKKSAARRLPGKLELDRLSLWN